MVESTKSVTSLLPFPGIPSRLGSAVLIQYIGYKHKVMTLVKCLSKRTSQYAVDNEDMLDQFWVIGLPVKFSEDWLGEKPEQFIDSAFPTLET